MGFNGIFALVMLGLQALEQASRVIGRIGATLQQGIDEGWTDDQWRAAAIAERDRTDTLDEATEARLDALINPPASAPQPE